MTDRPMDATEHPDEGLIHAWLDDALSAAEAERLAAHVRTCGECQPRVAEARGLIAGASRIIAALDDAPAGTRPGWAQGAIAGGLEGEPAGSAPAPPADGSLWRWLRVTPGRAALAATILVAIGITLTYNRAAIDSTARPAVAVLNPQRTDVPAATSPEGAASEAAKPRDALLDSAVAKNLKIAQGQRTMEAAHSPAIPSAPPPSTAPQPATETAGEAVALGRAAEEARRESPVVAADRSRADVGGAVSSRQTTNATAATMADVPQTAGVSAPKAAVQSQQMAGGAMMAKASANSVGRSCLLLESPDADARWADQPFPLVLAIEPGAAASPREAAVFTPSGEVTSLRAQWSPRGGDSVSVRLRRIGYAGSIAFGPAAESRSGIAVSAAAPMALEEVVASAAPAGERAAASRKAEATPAPRPSAAPAGPPVRQLRVTARSIACPAR